MAKITYRFFIAFLNFFIWIGCANLPALASANLLQAALNPESSDVTFSLEGVPAGFAPDPRIDSGKLEEELKAALAKLDTSSGLPHARSVLVRNVQSLPTVNAVLKELSVPKLKKMVDSKHVVLYYVPETDADEHARAKERVLQALAAVYFRRAHYSECRDILSRLASLERKQGNVLGEATALDVMSWTYDETSDYDEAHRLRIESRKLKRALLASEKFPAEQLTLAKDAWQEIRALPTVSLDELAEAQSEQFAEAANLRKLLQTKIAKAPGDYDLPYDSPQPKELEPKMIDSTPIVEEKVFALPRHLNDDSLWSSAMSNQLHHDQELAEELRRREDEQSNYLNQLTVQELYARQRAVIHTSRWSHF